MSDLSLHSQLQELYQTRDGQLTAALLTHADFQSFMNQHDIQIPLNLFSQAFIHTSFANEYQVPHQETLEFLGDAVLQLILTTELFERFPNEKEGKLSKLRSTLVNEKTLAKIARALGLDKLILVGKGEFQKNLMQQDVVLADSFEAMLGQVYRYQGIEHLKPLLLKWYDLFVENAYDISNLESFDAKSTLQQKVLAAYKKLPSYTAEAVGDKFEVKLWINETLAAQGVFASKKAGEKELAQTVLNKGSL
jgi:ribonuclease-3